MNYITNLGQYLFYFNYLWAPADFTQLQLWLQNLIYAIAQGLGNGVMVGLDVTPGANLSINIAPGVGLGTEGQVLSNNAPINTILPAPVANRRWDLIVLRPTVTNTDSIPDPNNPGNNVFLQQLLGFELVDITGTESANPVYPSAQDGDVILCGVQLTPGQMSVSQSNIDYGVRQGLNKTHHPVRVIATSYNVLTTDETLDANAAASGMIVQLPPALSVFGQDFVVTKIDTTANQVTVSGSDPIAGQPSLVLDSQWMYTHVRSVGTGWRVL
jgi:hypothetical protein